MECDQYEELCRYFIAKKAGLPIEDVKSGIIPNPRRPGLPKYKHQIDLYWETGDDIAQYLNIANAKWRGSQKVNQGEVLLLQQVRQKVSAHKAFMITNVGFTAGAVAAAKDEGIALHVVVPEFDTSILPRGDRASTILKLQQIAASNNRPIFSYRVEHRGLGFTDGSSKIQSPREHLGSSRYTGYETRIQQSHSLRGVTGPSFGRTKGGGETRGGHGTGFDKSGSGNPSK